MRRAVLVVVESRNYPGMLSLRSSGDKKSGYELRRALERGGFKAGDVVELRMLPKPRKTKPKAKPREWIPGCVEGCWPPPCTCDLP